MMSPAPLASFVLERARSDLYGAYCRNRLVELLEIDAASGCDALLRLIQHEVREVAGGLARIGSTGTGLIVQAGEGDPHRVLVVDVPAPGPHFVPRSTGDRVFGRGAAGGAAQAVLALAVLKLLGELRTRIHEPPAPVAVVFAAGGPPADVPAGPAVILVPSGGAVHRAQAGCVGVRVSFSGERALELYPFVAQAMEVESSRFQTESQARGGPPDLAWDALTQLNFGRLGPFGSHPALACERVSVRVRIQAGANPERIAMRMSEVLDATLPEYTRRRSDLVGQIDPMTGEPKLRRHYALSFEPARDALYYRIDVFGRRAYGACVGEADSAIAKAAFIFAALLRVARNFPNVRAEAALIEGRAGPIDLEAVQWFGPPHDAASIRRRLTAAAHSGLAQYHQISGRAVPRDAVRVEFPAPQQEPMHAPSGALADVFRAAFETAGVPWTAPSAWAGPSAAAGVADGGRPMVFFGPGRLERAGTDHECIEVPEIQQALAILTLAAL